MAPRAVSWLFLLSVGLTLLSSNAFVKAEEEEDVEVVEDAADVAEETYDDEAFDDDDDAISSSDIQVNILFPNHPTQKFPIGEEVTLLASFNNNGEKNFNISKISANLRSPFDYNYYIQNFTTKSASAVVGPNSQATLAYSFTPAKELEALEFWLSASVDYTREDGRQFTHTLVNGTVELIESSSNSASQLVMYVLVLAGLGGVGWLFTQGSAAGTITNSATTATKYSDEVENAGSWDDTKIYRQSEKSRRATSKNRKAGGKSASKKA
jgi:hypothetical protein